MSSVSPGNSSLVFIVVVSTLATLKSRLNSLVNLHPAAAARGPALDDVAVFVEPNDELVFALGLGIGHPKFKPNRRSSSLYSNHSRLLNPLINPLSNPNQYLKKKWKAFMKSSMPL